MKIVLIDLLVDPERPAVSGHSDIIWNMAKHLVSLHDQVTIVGPYRVREYPIENIDVLTYTPPPFAFRSILGFIFMILQASWQVRKIKDKTLIHSPDYVTTAIMAKFFPTVPVIMTTPGNIFERYARGNLPLGPLQKQVYKIAAKISAQSCAKIVATTKDMEYWWSHTGAAPHKIVTIPLGVDTELFRPIRNAKLRVGFETDVYHITHIGRLSSENQLENLLRAHAIILDSIPNVYVHLIGDGHEKDELLRLAVDLGIRNNVVCHGAIPHNELPIYYSAADVFVLARRWGGLPRAVLEAMACGCCVVTASSEMLKGIIVPNQTGLFVRPDDPENLAETLAKILTEPELKNSIQHNAREYALKNLDWGIVTMRIREEVYSPLSQPGVSN